MAQRLGQRHRHRREERGRRGVRHELGDDAHHGEEREQHRRLAPVRQRALQSGRERLGGAARLHGGAERNGAGDEDVDPRVDRAIGLGAREATAQHHRHRAREPGHLDGEHVERRQQHGGDHDGGGHGCLAPRAALALERHEHEDAGITGHPLERLVVTLQHEHVAGPQARLRDLLVQPAGLPPQPEHDRAVAAAEIELAERAARQLRARGDDRLDQPLGLALLLPGRVARPVLRDGMQLDAGLAADGHDVLGRSAHEEDVAHFQTAAAERAGHASSIAHEPDDLQTIRSGLANRLDGLAPEG